MRDNGNCDRGQWKMMGVHLGKLGGDMLDNICFPQGYVGALLRWWTSSGMLGMLRWRRILQEMGSITKDVEGCQMYKEGCQGMLEGVWNGNCLFDYFLKWGVGTQQEH